MTSPSSKRRRSELRRGLGVLAVAGLCSGAPSPAAVWLAQGPDTEAVSMLSFSADGTAVLVSTTSVTRSRIYLSGDSGLHWRAVGTPPQAIELADVAPNPGDRDDLWALDLYSGILRTSDGGNTWRVVVAQRGGRWVTQLILDRGGRVLAVDGYGNLARVTDEGRLELRVGHLVGKVVAGREALWARRAMRGGWCLVRSEDGFAHWRVVNCAAEIADAELVADPAVAERLWRFDADRTIHVSDDGGRTFSVTGVLPPAASGYVPDGRGGLFSPTRTGPADEPGVLMHSPDGGKSWFGVTGIPAGFGGPLAVDPTAPSKLLYGSSVRGAVGLERSVDGGETWLEAGGQGFLPPVEHFVVEPDRGGLWALVEGTLFQRGDPTMPWRRSTVHLRKTKVWTVVADARRGDWLWLSTDRGLLRTRDRGETWHQLPVDHGQLDGTLLADPLLSDVLFAASGNLASWGVTLRSADGGKSWRPCPGGPLRLDRIVADPATPERRVLVGAVYWPHQNPDFYAHVYESWDRGRRWRELRGYFVQDLDLSVALTRHPQSLVAAEWAGPLSLYRPDLLAWRPIDRDWPSHPIADLAVGRRDLYSLASTEPEEPLALRRSTDGGRSWELLAACPGGRDSAQRLTVVPGHPDRIFLTALRGLFVLAPPAAP